MAKEMEFDRAGEPVSPIEEHSGAPRTVRTAVGQWVAQIIVGNGGKATFPAKHIAHRWEGEADEGLMVDEG